MGLHSHIAEVFLQCQELTNSSFRSDEVGSAEKERGGKEGGYEWINGGREGREGEVEKRMKRNVREGTVGTSIPLHS